MTSKNFKWSLNGLNFKVGSSLTDSKMVGPN